MELVENQSDIYLKIQKADKNFKKSVKASITRSYIETHLENLEELWLEFKEGHRIIRSARSSKKILVKLITSISPTKDQLEQLVTIVIIRFK